MEIVITIILALIGLIAMIISNIRDEQLRHNKQLEKILKEQTELLSKIEQENRLIRIAVKSK